MSNESKNGSGMGFLQMIGSGLSQVHDVDRASGLCFYGVDQTSIAAEFITDIANSHSSIPVPTVHGGAVPGWVCEGKDVVLTSLDGDCEDVLRAYSDSRRAGARIHCLTSGGRLAEMCRGDGNHLIVIPSGLDEVQRFGFVLGALVGLTTDLGIMDIRGMVSQEVDRCMDVGMPQGDLRRVAEDISGNMSAVYSTSDIRSCAMWWRSRMCHHGLSFWSELPEYDHNELVGWSDPNTHAPELRMVVLKGSASQGLVSRIVDSMVRVLEINGRRVHVLDLGDGDTVLRNLRGFLYAEYVHAYLEGSQ